MPVLHLVRHGLPIMDPGVPAAEWELDPAHFDDVWALRDRLPAGAAWFASSEPKAVQTAELLTDGEVGIVPGLREQHRNGGWIEDFPAVVRAAFEEPGRPARPGWEPLDDCRMRVTATVRDLMAQHPGEDLVLVGHGTAWTVLISELTGDAPDVERWSRLGCPALLTVAG